MADQIIENLITQLSFDFDEDKLEKFDSLVEDAAKGLAILVAGATAAATAIFFFTKSVAESNDEIGKFAIRTGIGVEALQELGFVAELNGGSIDSMNSSLENLSRIASEAARGMGPGIEAFGMLGVSVTDSSGRLKDADTLLLDVADSIARLGSQAERLEFAQKLGIGGDLLLAIQQGSEAIKQQRKEARELGFVIDTDAADAAAAFNDELLRVNRIILGISNAIGTRFMKQIQPMIKSFTDWFKINKALIQQNISRYLDKVIAGTRTIVNITLRVVGMVNSLVSAMGGWKNAIIAVTGLLITMNASALLMPVLAVAAGAAILLILEDIIVFARGGDSAIGDLAKRFPALEVVLLGLLDILAMIRDGWVLIFTQGDEAFEGMLMMIQDVRKAFPVLNSFINFTISLLTVLKDKAIILAKTIAEGWALIFSKGNEAFEGLKMLINDLVSNFKPLEIAIEAIKNTVIAIPDAFNMMVEKSRSAINALTEMIRDFKGSIKNFLLDPLESVTNLINKIPGINIGIDDKNIPEGQSEPELIKNVSEKTEQIINKIVPVIESVEPVIEKASPVITESVEPAMKISNEITKSSEPIVDMITGKIPDIIDFSEPVINAAQPVINMASPIVENIDRTTSPVSRINNSNTSISRTTNNNKTVNPNITINIDGGDIEEVKKVVTEVLDQEYSGAQSNLNSQVEF